MMLRAMLFGSITFSCHTPTQHDASFAESRLAPLTRADFRLHDVRTRIIDVVPTTTTKADWCVVDCIAHPIEEAFALRDCSMSCNVVDAAYESFVLGLLADTMLPRISPSTNELRRFHLQFQPRHTRCDSAVSDDTTCTSRKSGNTWHGQEP